jgi:hypothetical protein
VSLVAWMVVYWTVVLAVAAGIHFGIRPGKTRRWMVGIWIALEMIFFVVAICFVAMALAASL